MSKWGRRIGAVFLVIVMAAGVAALFFGDGIKEKLFFGFNPSVIVQGAIKTASEQITETIPALGNGDDGGAALEKEENICKIRDAMINRQEEIVVAFWDSKHDYIDDGDSFFTDFVKPAMSEDYAEGCYSGDYLNNTVKSYDCSIRRLGDNYEVTLRVEYRDTAKEEQMVDSVIKEVETSLGLAEMNEAERVNTIYKFITSYVEYDEAAGKASLEGNPDNVAHTAYGALINGQAVCQGFACLFYAMCENAGLDARIISGTADNGRSIGSHAWNMVKVDGEWYYCDVTWDTCLKSIYWKYYMISEEKMGKDHFPSQ